MLSIVAVTNYFYSRLSVESPARACSARMAGYGESEEREALIGEIYKVSGPRTF